MKKAVSLLLVLSMVLSVTACTSSNQPESKTAANSTAANSTPADSAASDSAAADDSSDVAPYVGVTIFDYSNNFVGYVRNGIDYYVDNELKDVKYLMVDGENNQATQTERIDTMISKGINVLAVNPVDSSAAETIITKAKEADLPIVFFNRMPSREVMDSYDKCWYVGQDTYYQGQMEGEMVAEAWETDQEKWDVNGDGVLQYVLLKGAPGHSDAEDRANGFYSGIEMAGVLVEEVASEYANWSTTDAKEVMETWIGKYGDQIEMVVSGNDAMALGAVEALKGNGMITDEKIIPVVGVNALPEASELIKSGVMLGSILTSTYDAARAVMDLSVNAARGKEDVTEGTEWLMKDKIIKIPEHKITIDNVDIAVEAYKIAQ